MHRLTDLPTSLARSPARAPPRFIVPHPAADGAHASAATPTPPPVPSRSARPPRPRASPLPLPCSHPAAAAAAAMNFVSLLAALLAFIALLLTAISIATNHWFNFSSPRPTAAALNPVRTNSNLAGLVIDYDVDHFGLWVGCHKDKTFNKKSCAYIGNKCYSNVCWLRNKKDKTCRDDRVVSIKNCAAYQATRVMASLGTLALIFGASLLVVSACVRSKPLAATGGLLTGVASFFLMIAFAVFFSRIYKNDINKLGKIGWSFVLFIISWPLAFIASLLGCAANAAERKDQSAFESQG
jgi:PMP-22/EMP/MP20/Claudin tight junction